MLYRIFKILQNIQIIFCEILSLFLLNTSKNKYSGGKNMSGRIKEKEDRLKYYKNLFKNEKLFPEENNKIYISGIVEEDFYYGFKINKEVYYRTRVKVECLKGRVDYIPISISESFKDINWKESIKGKKIRIAGQLFSRDVKADGKNHLDLYVFVTSAQLIEEEDDFKPENFIYLNGYVCKEPICRITQYNRKLTDVILAVNRNKPGCDYIPAIAFFESADRTAEACVGTNMEIYGRLQSRNYKKLGIKKIAYEVSIKNIDRISI